MSTVEFILFLQECQPASIGRCQENKKHKERRPVCHGEKGENKVTTERGKKKVGDGKRRKKKNRRTR